MSNVHFSSKPVRTAEESAARRAPRVLSSVTPSTRIEPVSNVRTTWVAGLVSAILDGQDGATFGGYGRYVVGGAADSVVIRRHATRADVIATVHAFVSDAPITPGSGVGFWHDYRTGRTWVDRVTFHADLADAIRIADDRGELAVWDAVAREEIRLGR